MIVAKAMVAVWGILCAIVSMLLARSNGAALSLWYTLSAIVAGGLAGLFLLAFLSTRASRAGAYIGIAASLTFTAWATFTLGGSGRFSFPYHSYMIGVIGHIILLTVGYGASFVFPNADPAAAKLTLWGWRRPTAAPLVDVHSPQRR